MKYRIKYIHYGTKESEYIIQYKDKFFSSWKEETWHSFSSLEDARKYIMDKEPSIGYHKHPEKYDWYGF